MTKHTLRALSHALLIASRALMAEARVMPRQAPAPRSKRRKPRLSATRRAALRQQGRYIGTMRQLPEGQKTRVKRERETRGLEAAIRLARRLGRAA